MVRLLLFLVVILICLTSSWGYLSLNNLNPQIMNMKKFNSRHSLMLTMCSNSPSSNPSIGSEGEQYFIPGRVANINGPSNIIGKSKLVPIFPYNNIILPGSTEPLAVFDMRNRQLLQDVESNDGVFALGYYSQQLQRISLVGTLARIKERKIMEDGRISAIIEGVERFCLQKVISEKPYIKGVVKTFYDYTDSPDALDALEWQILEDITTNLKMMEMLNPSRSYSLTQAVLDNRPPAPVQGIRAIHLGYNSHDMSRRTKFSYAIIEMLRISPQQKLSLLQTNLIEKRYSKCLKLIARGSAFLRDELKSKGILIEDDSFIKLKSQVVDETLNSSPYLTTNMIPENFVDGKWVQMATIM